MGTKRKATKGSKTTDKKTPSKRAKKSKKEEDSDYSGDEVETIVLKKKKTKKVVTKVAPPVEEEDDDIGDMKLPRGTDIKIGYVGQNWGKKWTTGHTFRKGSFTPEKQAETVGRNLDDLIKILEYNIQQKIFFFRMSSAFVPWAAHPDFKHHDWIAPNKEKLERVGQIVKENNIRISMHPDHFVVLNSKRDEVVTSSIAELELHTKLLDAMQLDNTHKYQVHVGGVFGDKEGSKARFIERYKGLSQDVKRRLVIENDDHCYDLKDCLDIYRETGCPLLFDNLHHDCLNNGESVVDAFKSAAATWKPEDGVPMIDYSTQQLGLRKGTHASAIKLRHFANFVTLLQPLRADIMLEIKDKETSALRAAKLL